VCLNEWWRQGIKGAQDVDPVRILIVQVEEIFAPQRVNVAADTSYAEMFQFGARFLFHARHCVCLRDVDLNTI
jgi:hypothetical protein